VERPSFESVARALPKARIVEVARKLGLNPATSITVDELVRRIAVAPVSTLPALLPHLTRDELRAAASKLGLDATLRGRHDLIRALAAAAEVAVDLPDPRPRPADALPQRGDLAVVRQRQYLVEDVRPSATNESRSAEGAHLGAATRVSLVCLDDDAQGQPLEVLWELELGARIIDPTRHGLGAPAALDSPEAFTGYLRTRQWDAVTATDAGLFQSPFRSGILLLHHQLTPLLKALRLPRVNLFIADDVGLGKTIEAGLVTQELILRQRVSLVLIVCPPSVALQWRDEMRQKFGLRFEIYDRDFVNRRRAERGFGVNAWGTHDRFIVSYQTLRRSEHMEPLLAHLGHRARKSMLILDEAHTVAPSSGSKYAVDSDLTRVIRDHVAPRFENRLFLSATPHNGHSNSFAALLEILDPHRFTRTQPIDDPTRLEPVLVRRLKSDLGPLGDAPYPVRVVRHHRLTHRDGHWWQEVLESRPHAPEPAVVSAAVDLGAAEPHELALAQDLARYTQLMDPGTAQGQLVFTNLQKRLLSCAAAFHRTFDAHCVRPGRASAATAQLKMDLYDDDAAGADEDATEDYAAGVIAAASRELRTPDDEAAVLRERLRTVSDYAGRLPDARIRALVEWIRTQQCKAARVGGPAPLTPPADKTWTPRSLLVFTEYGDTRKYILSQLRAAIDGTEDCEHRIASLHGGMGDDGRAEVQRAFNGDPAEEPVRILVCTDAAREGINLQTACADLFHFDVPWNPARLEQRNGRIDRTLQPEPEVRCAYFTCPDRPEDRVLDLLVRKVDTIRHELGSVGTVVLDRIDQALARGINAATADDLERVTASPAGAATAKTELETQRTPERLRREIDEARRHLDRSRKVVGFEPTALRLVVDVALGWLGVGPLVAEELVVAGQRPETVYRVPSLPRDWQGTVDTLRPPRPRDQAFWEWRRTPPRPVVFQPPRSLSTPVVHLHLEHPFIQRILARFKAQGFAAHDLSRVSALGNPYDAQPRALAIGRLSLFGTAAARLHDELVHVSAPWFEAGGPGHCVPTPDDSATRERLQRLLAEPLRPVSELVRKRLVSHAVPDFGALWPAVEAEADARAHDAREKLARRGEEEAAELTRILQRQAAYVDVKVSQTTLDFKEMPADEVRQIRDDLRYLEGRRATLATELAREPAALKALYEVRTTRIEPVGLLYLWPVGA
jgi:hypothetical protein